MCACFGVSVPGSEVNLQHCASGSHPLCFLAQSLSPSWDSPSRLGWLTNGTHGVCCVSAFPLPGIEYPCPARPRGLWGQNSGCHASKSLAISLACSPAATENCFFEEPEEQTFVGNFQVATRYKVRCLVFISKPKCHIILT